MRSTSHRLVVVGAGSGNILLDPRFDGWDVAIVEAQRFGGTCLNAGCIPTKMLAHPAGVALQAQEAAAVGVRAGEVSMGWPQLRDRVFDRVDTRADVARGKRLAPTSTTTVYEGEARFTGPRRLAVRHPSGVVTEVRGDQIVIAAGARPAVPEVIAASGVPYDTSETLMRVAEVPRRLVVLGGGYVGTEFAHIFSAAGAEVTVVTRGEQLLRGQDEAVARAFTEVACRRWDVRLGRSATAAGVRAGRIRLTLDDGSTVSGDRLLVATGRRSNADRLDVGRGGVAVHPDGRVVVDAHQRTTAPGVWAIGDVSSAFQLKHVANREARTVAHNLLHPEDLRATDHTAVPSAVFSDPEVAAVGMTEAQVRAAGIDHHVAVREFRDVAYGWAMGDPPGFCKILAERSSHRLLGAHILGAHAATLIQPLVQAMAFGLPAPEVARRPFWIHPALSEVVENALLGLEPTR
ncbi:MAG: mycothione reductase [Pseudonocardia sp.]